MRFNQSINSQLHRKSAQTKGLRLNPKKPSKRQSNLKLNNNF